MSATLLSPFKKINDLSTHQSEVLLQNSKKSQPWVIQSQKVSSKRWLPVSYYLLLSQFSLAVGTAVKADEVIARIETDKVTVDILAAFDGVVTKYHCEEGDTVPVGAPFVDIDSEATASSTPAAAEAPKKEAAPEPTKAAEPVKAAPA